MEFLRCDEIYFPVARKLYHDVVRELKRTVNYPKWGAHHPSEEDLQGAFDNGTLYICVDNDARTCMKYNEDILKIGLKIVQNTP